MSSTKLLKKTAVFEKLASWDRTSFLKSFAQDFNPKEMNDVGNDLIAHKNKLVDTLTSNFKILTEIDANNNNDALKVIYQNLKYALTGNDVKVYSDINDQVKKLDAVVAPFTSNNIDNLSKFKIDVRTDALAVLQDYKKYYYMYNDLINLRKQAPKDEEPATMPNLTNSNLYSTLLKARDANLSQQEISELAKSVPQLKQRLQVIEKEVAEKQDSTNPYQDEQGLTDAQKVSKLLGEKTFINQILNKYKLA